MDGFSLVNFKTKSITHRPVLPIDFLNLNFIGKPLIDTPLSLSLLLAQILKQILVLPSLNLSPKSPKSPKSPLIKTVRSCILQTVSYPMYCIQCILYTKSFSARLIGLYCNLVIFLVYSNQKLVQ